MDEEIWKQIPGFGGHYEASDQGRIRVKNRIVICHDGRQLPMNGKIRAASKSNKHGHLKMSLGVDGKSHNKFVHHLVLLAFVGPRPPGMEACHRNDDPADNRPSNLRWDTRMGNISDRGPPRRPYPVGAAHAMAKLNDEGVRKIRVASGPCAKVAQDFGVSKNTVLRIRNRQSWAHVV